MNREITNPVGKPQALKTFDEIRISIASPERILSWSFGDGSISYQDVFSHEYAFEGEYVVELVAENPLSCNLIDLESVSTLISPSRYILPDGALSIISGLFPGKSLIMSPFSISKVFGICISLANETCSAMCRCSPCTGITH